MTHKLIYNVNPTHLFKEFYTAKGYSSKEEYKEQRNGCVTFKTSDSSIQLSFKKFISLIKEGHEFRSVTGKKSRSQRSFLYSYVVPVDVDSSNISLKELIEKLDKDNSDLIPSIAYETFSNKEGDYRYRLLYVFNEGLKTRKFKSYYKYIVDNLNKVFPKILPDSAFLSPVHSFLGTDKDKYIYCSNKVFYSFIDIDTYDVCILAPISNENGCIKSLSDSEEFIYKLLNLSVNDILDAQDAQAALAFNSDIYIKEQYVNSPKLKALMDETCGRNALSPVEFINKHKDEYEIIEHTLVEFGNKTMIVRPDNYYDIDWLRIHNGGKQVRRHDGQRRKTTLGMVAIYLRLIKPSITPDEMYYNLVHERLNYYNNDDFSLKNHYLKSIIKSSYLLEQDEVEIREANMDINKPVYVIDVKRRKSIGSVVGHKPTRKHPEYFSMIDWTKSCKENFEKIKENFPNLNENNFKANFSHNKNKFK